MTNIEFVQKAMDIAKNYKTLYVMGCFGAPMTASNKARYTKNHVYNMSSERTSLIKNSTSDTFGFDCVGLIKGILWGWNGDRTRTYGGASYISNMVPDIDANQMIRVCGDKVSMDFKKIVVGAVVWKKDHIGIYIGNGQVVECSPKWKNGVQISNLGNLGKDYEKGNYRLWTSYGQLPYISYEEEIMEDSENRVLEYDEFEALIRRIVREELNSVFVAMDAAEPTEDWQKDWLELAKSKGISDGTRPMSFCTRLEAMIMSAKSQQSNKEE